MDSVETTDWERAIRIQSHWLNSVAYTIDYHAPPVRQRTAIIVEPRPHLMLRAVVENMLYALNGGAEPVAVGDGWNLMVVTSVCQKDWLREALSPHRYMVKYLNLENLTRSQYSRLLMTAEFWEAIPTEHILIFQTDTLALRRWNPVFEEYDYLGANYFNPADILMGVGGIQGGLSYRKRSAMICCLCAITEEDVQTYRKHCGFAPITTDKETTAKELTAKELTGGNTTGGNTTDKETVIAEDIYFTHAAAMLQKKLPSPAFRPLFSLEADYYESPFGLHGWNHPYFNRRQFAELCWSSPIFRPFVFQIFPN